jgi:hypothetical protein
MRILLAVAAMMLGLSGEGKAEIAGGVSYYVSGNMLHEWCQFQNDDPCMAYALGVVDMTNGSPYNGVCFQTPEGAMNTQIKDVVKAWLEKHPGDRHIQASSLVIHALNEAWPCKK